jgi:hypothetical protein
LHKIKSFPTASKVFIFFQKLDVLPVYRKVRKKKCSIQTVFVPRKALVFITDCLAGMNFIKNKEINFYTNLI